MANLPIFAVGDYSKIQPAIESGILSYPAYVFIYSGDYKNRFAFIDKNLEIQMIVGDSVDLDSIESVVTELQTSVEGVTDSVTEIQSSIDALQEAVDSIKETVAFIELDDDDETGESSGEVTT